MRIGGGPSPVDAALDPSGVRLATRQAGATSHLLPDLHGNAAALWGTTANVVTDAFRYDPYGEELATVSSGAIRTPWRFQGRLLEGEAGDPELYDFGFRSYAADLGTFASLDNVAGSAQDPLSLNRFLYAAANPETMSDPTGHWFEEFDPFGFAGDLASNVGNFGVGMAEGFGGALVESVAGTVGMVAGAGGCALDGGCRQRAAQSISAGVTSFAADPAGSLGRAGSAAIEAGKGLVASSAERIGGAWERGDFRELGKVTGEIASNVIPAGAVLTRVGGLAKAMTGGPRHSPPDRGRRVLAPRSPRRHGRRAVPSTASVPTRSWRRPTVRSRSRPSNPATRSARGTRRPDRPAPTRSGPSTVTTTRSPAVWSSRASRSRPPPSTRSSPSSQAGSTPRT